MNNHILISKCSTMSLICWRTAPFWSLIEKNLHIDTKPEIVIHNGGKPTTEREIYYGFGKIDLSCQGHGGDNTTTAYWIRTDVNGNNVTLNTTAYELETPGLWKVILLDRPVRKATYNYQCVVENRCCKTKISEELTILYFPTNGKQWREWCFSLLSEEERISATKFMNILMDMSHFTHISFLFSCIFTTFLSIQFN